MAETLSWRLAPVSTTKRERLARLPGGLSLLPACPYLCGVLARFFSSHRSGRTLGIHRLPSPAHPAALSGVVLDHPLHQLLEEAHAPPSLETLVDHACGDPKPLAVQSLPLASRPQHVPDGVDDGSI